MRSKTAFDCFCGFGGLSVGGQLAGLEIIGGVDAEPSAVGVFSQCFPESRALCADLLQSRPRDILRGAGISRGDVDVLAGGPPCQPYSVNNHRRGLADARCGLVQRYLEFVSMLRPNWLVMENVPAFASIEDGKFFQSLLRSLRARGYRTAFGILEAVRFGVPQRRRRLIVLASREPELAGAAMKQLLDRKGETVTVGEALGDLAEKPEAGYQSEPANPFQGIMRKAARRPVQAHAAAGLGRTNLERMRHVPPGGNWRDIPRALLPPGMLRAKLSDHTTRYGRLNPGQPAYTLLTKCDPHWGCFVHPTQDRVITVREAARLQSIPDHVEFHGTRSVSYRLIGNAVPPLLARGIFEALQ